MTPAAYLWILTVFIRHEIQKARACANGPYPTLNDLSKRSPDTRYGSSWPPVSDHNLQKRWYRVDGYDIATTPPLPTSCNTMNPVWITGTIPSTSDGITTMTACMVVHHVNCPQFWHVKVQNCGLFRIYELLPTQTLNTAYCFEKTVHGCWSEWTSWSECSKSCGSGVKQRTRSCTNPSPKHGGHYCSGSSTNSATCTICNCPAWSLWGGWSSCVGVCGWGTVTRSRCCINRCGQGECSGSATSSKNCRNCACQCTHGWTNWSSWSHCSPACGPGFRHSTRSCYSANGKCVIAAGKTTGCYANNQIGNCGYGG